MFLKSIEIHGFKSFANKTLFQFHNGITGIVGPNGSGKSNVADAVRWVLGEQSAKSLRGSNMQDVIFSGTEARRPLGYASVSITLDNSDHQLAVSYDEVTVTRRVYRSGESEYLMNGTQVRLRDINELFYDTGIGKEGYSIIGQGQVERILNGKPEERRELFDEAVGIVKYKRRKSAAVKKLDEEKANLTRISDILSELDRQVGPMERQAEKARIYLKKRDELKEQEVRLFLTEAGRLRKEQQTADENFQNSDSQLQEIRTAFEKAREDYDIRQAQLEAMDEQLSSQKDSLAQGRMQRQELENQCRLNQEQIKTLEQSRQMDVRRLETIENELTDLDRQRRQTDASVESSVQELEKVREEEAEALRLQEKIRGIIDLNSETVEAQQNEIIRILGERTSVRTRLQRQDTMMEQAQIRRSALTQQILEAKSNEELQKTELGGILEDEEALNARIDEENAKAEARSEELEKLQQSLSQVNAQTEQEQVEYHREASRLESLRNIAERYDGYGNSIRKVMEQKSTHSGILGVVADLITTEKEYETAIETALGGSIQNIVTDTEQTAKQMIAFLKEGKYGRATFLPMDGLVTRGTLEGNKAVSEKGIIGIASELVQTEAKYSPLAQYLLGKTLVADTIDHALAVARKNHHSLRIVTLEGELLSPGGSMTGGAFRNSSNLLGRRREIEELQLQVRKKAEHLKLLQERIDAFRQERARLREELVASRDRMQELYLEQNTLKMKRQELTDRHQETLDGYERLRREAREIEQSAQDIDLQKASIRRELETSQRKEQDSRQEIELAQAALERHRPALEEATQALESIRVRLASIGQQESFDRQNAVRIQEEIRKRQEEKKEIDVRSRQTDQDIIQKNQVIAQLAETIGSAGEQLERLEEQIHMLEQERAEKSTEHKTFFDRREELSERIRLLDRECFRLNAQREKLAEQRESLINYMWEEYEITLSDAQGLPVPQEEIRPQELKRQIQKIKAEIKELGSVNVNAIEEYKELSERHTLYSTQYEDLVKSGEALEKVIRELDQGMRAQFKEQFVRIQNEFDKSFRELFGGGKGSLELTEEDDILDAGIRIIAQPPGKKLQNMMQLSGGEKALTAIALLFAIQNLKPSPFCLLDEIEAALDENNVDRYANYLHKLTKNTQFIIITHRRGTMTAADRLYGITMQEKGVSALVSVNLIEEQLDA